MDRGCFTVVTLPPCWVIGNRGECCNNLFNLPSTDRGRCGEKRWWMWLDPLITYPSLHSLSAPWPHNHEARPVHTLISSSPDAKSKTYREKHPNGGSG